MEHRDPAEAPPPAAPEGSLGLICDARGVLRRVLYDGLDATAPVRPGDAVARIVDADARDKFDAFVAECAATASAIDWQIAVPRAGRLLVLHFAGLRLDADELLVVASLRRLAAPAPALRTAILTGEEPGQVMRLVRDALSAEPLRRAA